MERVNIIFNIPYLIQRQVLSKNQIALSNKGKLEKCLKFDSRSTDWQSALQNLLTINLTNFVR